MSDVTSEQAPASPWSYPTRRDPEWTVASGLRDVVARNPSGKPDAGFSFMQSDGKTIDHMTFAEILAEVQRRGRHLLARGIEPGDVMVAPATDPAWTPLFVTAGGVVVDVGAPMSHAMIVSRELGVPCVTGITNGSMRIKDGMLLEVDGGAGTVRILDAP